MLNFHSLSLEMMGFLILRSRNSKNRLPEEKKEREQLLEVKVKVKAKGRDRDRDRDKSLIN